MKLPVNITMASAAAVHRELSRIIGARGAGSEYLIDASALAEVDSSALALLMDAQRMAHERGLRLRVTGLPAQLLKLAALYGVEDLLGGEAVSVNAAVDAPISY